MFDSAQLKERLIASGKLTPDRIDKAQEFAVSHHVSLAEALVSMLMISYPDLGQCCSEITGMPYRSVASQRPPADAIRQLSSECAAAWKVFPVDFDPVGQNLTLAVHDPDQARTLQGIYRFFMLPHCLDFSIAPGFEIEKALQKYLGVQPPARRVGSKTIFWQRKKIDLGAVEGEEEAEDQPTRSPYALKRRSTGETVYGGDIDSFRTGFGYEHMSSALISATTLLVRTYLVDDPDKLAEVRTCVRYCQLMASRLKLEPVQTDALTLAAWLSAIENKRAIAKQLITPYKLDEVLSPDTSGQDRGRAEAWVLALVRCYLELRSRDRATSRDINLTRRQLRMEWSPSAEWQDMLEAFLQVLVDEEFLAKLERSAGRILIVDPAEDPLCKLGPSLVNDGYEVMAVPDAAAAEEILDEFSPELVIADVVSSNDGTLAFCKKIKEGAETAGVTVLTLVDEDDKKLAAASLRAGADDFLRKPVDLELLFLKIQSRLATPEGEAVESGVSGSLDEMDFTDMIQILSSGRKSMEITLGGRDEEGRVYIREGEVVHAEVGELQGENAFYALMKWGEGTFTTRQCSEFPARTIDTSVMSLLMEGSRQADEQLEA